jgi:predicted amidohydrolase
VHALRVTVCELPDDRTAFERAWRQLVGHVKAEQSDLLVLPEMPFAPWLAVSPAFDRDAWERANWAADDGGGDFGGAGWVIDPDGRVLNRTSPDQPGRDDDDRPRAGRPGQTHVSALRPELNA